MNNRLTGNLRYDFPASIVVFLVALPLCLGIALASGVPNLFAGLIAGIIGGIVVGSISKSNVSVSGPAAGLTVIVLNGIKSLETYEVFLAAVVVAGAVQLILGLAKAGTLGSFFPTSVIKGMLAAIGLILFFKQVPHFLGYDADYEGDASFMHADSYAIIDNLEKIGEASNHFTDVIYAAMNPNIGATLIGSVSLMILILWGASFIKKNKILSLIPAPLLVVFASIGINTFFAQTFPSLALGGNHLVEVPVPKNLNEFTGQFVFPDFTKILSSQFLIIAFTIAVIASLETLLSVDAADKLDPFRRTTPSNRELVAQGVGNMASGMIGGLPVTAVIVRSSANIASGARSKMSAILHGIFLLLAVVLIPGLLNMIPKAALAAILLQVAFKLVKPSIFFDMYTKGWSQFIPFVVTVVAIFFTDLLVGIVVGMIVGLYYVIKTNFRSAIAITHDKQDYLIRFKKDVSFLNKLALRRIFDRIPNSSYVVIDINKNLFMDYDIREAIDDFRKVSVHRDITIEIKYSTKEMFKD